MLPILTRHFNVTAVDLPGHGKSPNLADEAGSSLVDYSRAIAQLLPANGSRALVMGHSLGALIALDLAKHYPQRILATIALNAVFRRTAVASAAVKARARELINNDAPDPTRTLIRWFGQNPQGDIAHMADQCRRWLTEVDRNGYRRAYTIFAGQDGPADADLRNLACSALFITGSQEPNSTPEMSQAMAQLAPRGRAVIVDGAKHMMPMTHAAEVCAHLLEFVKHLDRSHESI